MTQALSHRAAKVARNLHALRELADDPELRRILRIAGGGIGEASIRDLQAQLARQELDEHAIDAALERVRTTLAEAPANAEHVDARPDADAALRWHGACLDDLLGRYGRA